MDKKITKNILTISFITIFISLIPAASLLAQQYDTTKWNTLKNYQTPEWFRDAKFGIYLHWGVYSVPAFGNEWYGYEMYDKLEQSPSYALKTVYPHHLATYGDPAVFGYKDLIPLFKAENFNADTLMSYVANSGAKYFAHLTSHHDAFLMYHSRFSKWNCVNMGPKKDVGLLFQAAAKKRGLHFGISNHLAENNWFFQFNWHNNFDANKDPELVDLYNDSTNSVDLTNTEPSDRWVRRWLEISEEMIDYFKPDYVYYDRGWSMHPKWTPYRKILAAYQYNKAIEWGKGVYGAPGVALLYKDSGLLTGSAILDHENGIPSSIQVLPFQSDESISNNGWCYVAGNTYKSAAYLVNRLVDIVSKNGNMMLSIDPKADGTLPDTTRKRLIELGNWMQVNGEAIYATRPAETFGMEGANQIRFTRNKDSNVIYIFSSGWPGDNAVLNLTPYNSERLSITKISKITLLGAEDHPLKWSQNEIALSITMPSEIPVKTSPYCYVFKMYLDKAMSLPCRPSNLTAVSSAKGIALSWVNNSSQAKSFIIERKNKDKGNFKQLAVIGHGVTSFVDTGASTKEIYIYRIRSYNTKGNSGYSEEVIAGEEKL